MVVYPSVLLPYRFTLFSNKIDKYLIAHQFYYLIDLHYSQTHHECSVNFARFYYLIDLHYSQTVLTSIAGLPGFTTL